MIGWWDGQVKSNYFVPKDSGLLLSKNKMRLFFSPEAAHGVGEKPVRLKYVSVKRRHMVRVSCL